MSSMSEISVVLQFSPDQGRMLPINCQRSSYLHWTGPHEIVDQLSPVAYRIKSDKGAASQSFDGSSKPDKEAPGLQPIWKGEDQTH